MFYFDNIKIPMLSIEGMELIMSKRISILKEALTFSLGSIGGATVLFILLSLFTSYHFFDGERGQSILLILFIGFTLGRYLQLSRTTT